VDVFGIFGALGATGCPEVVGCEIYPAVY